MFNPEGFSFKALAREPEAREHRKRSIDASAFRRAIRPVPVLLFGVTTLRVILKEQIVPAERTTIKTVRIERLHNYYGAPEEVS